MNINKTGTKQAFPYYKSINKIFIKGESAMDIRRSNAVRIRLNKKALRKFKRAVSLPYRKNTARILILTAFAVLLYFI